MERIKATLPSMPLLERASEFRAYQPDGKAQDAWFSVKLRVHRMVEEKSFVCALYAFDADGSSLDLSGSSWPLSARLGAPYQYLPRLDSSTRIELKPFNCNTRFSALIIALLPWAQSSESTDVSFGESFCGSRVVIDGKHFVVFNSLFELESLNG